MDHSKLLLFDDKPNCSLTAIGNLLGLFCFSSFIIIVVFFLPEELNSSLCKVQTNQPVEHLTANICEDYLHLRLFISSHLSISLCFTILINLDIT